MLWRPFALLGGYVPLLHKALSGHGCREHLASKTVEIQYARVAILQTTSIADCAQDDFLAGGYSIQHHH